MNMRGLNFLGGKRGRGRSKFKAIRRDRQRNICYWGVSGNRRLEISRLAGGIIIGGLWSWDHLHLRETEITRREEEV